MNKIKEGTHYSETEMKNKHFKIVNYIGSYEVWKFRRKIVFIDRNTRECYYIAKEWRLRDP